MSRNTPPDMTTKQGRAGLTMRLEERRRVFLPLYSVPQVKDVKR